jgi:hypothetical protein
MLAGVAVFVGGPASAGGNPPRVDYMLHCMGCHRDDGGGLAGEVPQLKGFVGRFLYVEGGREYLVQVPGVAQAALDDAALAGVLNWMLETFSPAELPADFVPYSGEEVSRYRRDKLIDVSGRRKVLVGRMPD